MFESLISPSSSTEREKSWISRTDSSALKGLFILFIVMGHIRGITFGFQNYIYCFHVQCFFILPFLYPSKHLTKKNIFNLFLKLLWPFLLLYAILTLLDIFVLHDSSFISSDEVIPGVNNIVLGIWSFIAGGISLLNKFSGTQFLWFLPSFFSMCIIRMLYNKFHFKTYQK